MKAYRLNEADIAVPEAWQDNTIHAFSTPATEKTGAANFVITRDGQTRLPDVQSYADQQLVEAAKKLKGYKLIGRRPVQISGRAAIEADFTWMTPERIEIQQRQGYVKWSDVFVVFTLSARAGDFAKHESTWDALMQSIRLREE